MTKAKSRITWLDMAKGYGMIFVILGHLNIGIVRTWIYTFHIPLYFLLSGYVFSEKNNFSTFLKKKCKSMLIPYFCLGIPMLLFDGIGHYILGDYNIQDCIHLLLKFLVQRRAWTLWFLACLFFLNIFFYIAVKVFKTDKNLGIFSIITTIIGLLYYKFGGVALPWNIDVCLMAFPFFFSGYFFKKHYDKIEKYLDDKKTSIVLFIIFGIINVICGFLSFKISGSGLEMYGSSYGFAPLTYISAFAGILCVIIVSKWTTIKAIKYIGENSLLYFAWHQTIMIPISSKCLSLLHFTLNESSNLISIGMYKVLQLVIIVSALTICNIIITKTKLKSFLGK